MKLLVSDYDGTFNSSLGLPSIFYSNKVINNFRENGNKFVLATARNYSAMMKRIKKYEIPYDYLICSNGCAIFDKDGNLIYSKNIDKNSLSTAVIILEAFGIVKKIYLYNAFGEETDNLDEVCELYVLLNPVNIGDIALLKGLLHFLNIFKCLHILTITENVDKSMAIEILCKNKEESLDKEDIFTVGNSYNDRTMLENYNGYKMFFSGPSLFNVDAKVISSVPSLAKKITRSNS